MNDLQQLFERLVAFLDGASIPFMVAGLSQVRCTDSPGQRRTSTLLSIR